MTTIVQRLKKFCATYKKIYLYGAGAYGRKLLAALHSIGLEVDGFLVTNGQEGLIMGKPVLLWNKAAPNLFGAGIILALSERWHSVIRKELSQTGVEILSMRDDELRFLYNQYSLLPLLRQLVKTMPTSQNVPSLVEINKILVIRLDVLGDLLMTIPMLRELRRNTPQAQIDMVARMFVFR